MQGIYPTTNGEKYRVYVFRQRTGSVYGGTHATIESATKARDDLQEKFPNTPRRPPKGGATPKERYSKLLARNVCIVCLGPRDNEFKTCTECRGIAKIKRRQRLDARTINVRQLDHEVDHRTNQVCHAGA